jgi:hypothetical protein
MWAIWICRNDVIFTQAGRAQFLQVIYKATHWINLWSLHLSEDQRGHMDIGCARLMVVVQAIFNQDGWLHTNKNTKCIGSSSFLGLDG